MFVNIRLKKKVFVCSFNYNQKPLKTQTSTFYRHKTLLKLQYLTRPTLTS